VQLLGISLDRLNVHGGGVSLGHPIGSSGARIAVSLTHILRQKVLLSLLSADIIRFIIICFLFCRSHDTQHDRAAGLVWRRSATVAAALRPSSSRSCNTL
jgi:hypothetical protein